LSWFGGRPGPIQLWPWFWWTEVVVNDYFLTHKGPYTAEEIASIGSWATTTALIFALPQVVSKLGTGTIAWITGIYYAGKWTSQAIDSEEGKDNFHGYISGGSWPGSNEPDYYGGGASMSPTMNPANRPGAGGYFDVVGNMAIIGLQWKEDVRIHKLEQEIAKTKIEAEETRLRQEQTRLIQESIQMGSFTTPEDLYRYGYIDIEEYLKRLEMRRAKTFKEMHARKKWNALSKQEQKDLVKTKRALDIQGAMIFSQGSW